jgi:hypothetical protein
VIVGVHQAIGMAEPRETLDDVPEYFEEALAVEVVKDDRPARSASGDDVVEATGDTNSRRPRHGSRVNRGTPRRNCPFRTLTLSSHLDKGSDPFGV